MHTEEEAEKLWCPFARVAFGWTERMFEYHQPTGVGCAVNRGDGVETPTNCIASKCAAWRWAGPQMAQHNSALGVSVRDVVGLRGNQPKLEIELRRAGYSEGKGENNYTCLPRQGFCGLAGKPE